MGRERKCILCEMVCNSKQEMDEHMRSMLHHRELENLKGRDCGHACKVCHVTVVSLTDYASHISSPVHKQNVEVAERKNAGNDQDEDYFDQELVDLIKKRKELIRKEEEAAEAKRAKEEAEQRKQQEFQQRLKEAKERFRQDCSWRQPQRGFGGFNRQGAFYGNNLSGGSAGEAVADSRPWHHSKLGKSATWHAQEPPNFHNWASGKWASGGLHSQDGSGNKQCDQGSLSGTQRGRLPWLSNRGSSYGVYGRNNIPLCPQQSRPLSLLGPIPRQPPPPSVFARTIGQIQNQGSGQGEQQDDGHQNGEGANAECDRNSSKAFGSNQKLDKVCRWSPYPPTKFFETAPQKDTHPIPSEKYPKLPAPQKQEKAADTSTFNKQSRFEQKPRHLTSSGDNIDGKKRHKKKKNRDRSSSGSRSSSAQRNLSETSSPTPSNQKADKPSEHKDMKLALISGLNIRAQHSKASSQEHAQSKSTSRHGGLGSKSSPIGLLQSKQEQQVSDMPRKAKETVLEKRGSVDISSDNRMETALHIVEEQQGEHPESRVRVNKENNCWQNEAKPTFPDLIRPYPSGDEKVNHVLPSSGNSQYLQSVQVSTSTVESSEPSASGREDEEDRKQVEKGMGSVAPDEGMQAVEAGQGSETDTSRSGEAQTVSGSTAPSLPNLGLPPALKRDLTKHISSKVKTGSHEPNLNSARRVRNVSESRRGETEKESGLKPTVRQLISSSGSRRNVNWEQVYQEVRKKQEQGKGMPRFGIEMVSCDQEEQSQEEDNIRLLEGLQWEMLMDNPAPVAPRKRCLSESSITPDCSASSHSLFPAEIPRETAQRDGLSWPGAHNPEQQGSASPPSSISAQGKRVSQPQRQDERMLGQCEAKAQKQLERIQTATVKALQRSDSALGDSSSGTELCDGQGTGKKRRAAGESDDITSPEIPCLERKNKRRKIKSKKEQLQVDQLLAVSLREEELSRSLQTVDNSLIQARAALEAAYLEVQRLMVVKQQVTGEMNSLRNKRIELLKGMQGGFEDSPRPKVKEEKTDSFGPEPRLASVHSSIADSAVLSPCSAAQCASPPSSTLPSTRVVIKQEPQSPVHVSTEPDPVESTIHCAHSASPELPVPPAAVSHADRVQNCQLSHERRSELYQAKGEPAEESVGAAAECKESSPAVVQMTERALRATRDSLTPSSDSKPATALSSASRRSSEAGRLADPTASQSCEPSSVPLGLTLPLSPPELRTGKRVRRLKKRKTLKKAQGVEQPESSDTEADGEASRPRWVRARRRPSCGSHVSTSTPPTTVEDEERDRDMEGDLEGFEEASDAARPDEEDLESSLGMVELPQTASAERVNTEPEEIMEVTTACQQPQMVSHTLSPSPAQVPDSSRPEPQTLACNEVTSTSDMDVSPVVKPYESDVPMPLALPKMPKTSSDVSSDHGEDEMPTEGPFEGHQEAVNAMQIHNGLLYTCSGDRTVKAFNLVSHRCVSVFEGHSSKVNCLVVSAAVGLHHRLYSGSSDQTIRCYSLRTKEFEQQFSLSDRVLCLHNRWKVLYAGLANGTVVTFNLKTNKQLDVFDCHGPRGVSCLASAQEGARKILLVGSYDSTISVRDANNGLLLRTLEGHTKTVLCMKVVNDLVFSGSSDQSVHAHNFTTGELVRIYKGHHHAVTVVAILGKMMVTACLDKLVRIYKLQSHEQLQVYGGHKDMVMCMAIHKSMIYTGCYDGSVQAVKLNLTQNYRCWWHGCSLSFGVMEHLQHHLISDHTSTNLRTLKCHWKNCEAFFCAHSTSKQALLTHMQRHAEEEMKLKT